MRPTVATVVLSGLVSFFASSRAWLHVTAVRQPPFGPETLDVTGRHWFSFLTILSFAAVAAGVLILVVRGLGRRFFGVMLVLIGAGLAVPGVAGKNVPDESHLRDLIPENVGGTALSLTGHVVLAWSMIVLGCGLVIALAGALTVVQGGEWDEALSRRYERPADGDRTDDAWRTLDRGDDPTLGGL